MINVTLDKCEICGQSSENVTIICNMCGRFICPKCVGEEDEHAYHTDYTCNVCWDIGKPYRAKIDKMQELVEELEAEYAEKCRGSR